MLCLAFYVALLNAYREVRNICTAAWESSHDHRAMETIGTGNLFTNIPTFQLDFHPLVGKWYPPLPSSSNYGRVQQGMG